MPIYFEPDYERRAIQQGISGMQSILTNLGLLAIQQKFRAKEAETARTHAETLQLQLAGFGTQAPTDRKTTTPTGGTRRVPAAAVQPDVEIGERKYYHKGFQPQVLGTLKDGSQIVRLSPYSSPVIHKRVKGTIPRSETSLEMHRGAYNAAVASGDIDPEKKSFYQWYTEEKQKLKETTVIESTPGGGTRIITGTGSGIQKHIGIPTGTEYAKVRSQKAAAMASLAMIRELTAQTKDNPEIIGFAGFTARSIDRAYEQARAFGKKLGDTATLERSKFSHIFKGWKSKAADSAAFQSRAIQLAYTMARALDPSGRLSDFDVEVQLRSMALRSGSPTQLAAALSAKARDVVSTYTTAYKTVHAKDAEVEKWMDLSDLRGGGYSSPDQVREAYKRKELTLEEAKELLQRGFE
jgi:hypothetical protein